MARESHQEDIFTIDVKGLITKYINPIERMRSISAPSILGRISENERDLQIQAEINSVVINTDDALESRAHAFYRMLGLPVISKDGDFYNPGFNPRRGQEADLSNYFIANEVPQNIRQTHHQREHDARNRYAIFKKRGLESSIYALVLPIIKSFQVINNNIEFTELDQQRLTIPERRLFLRQHYKQSNNEEITDFKDTVTHILRPFTVDPAIEHTVMPADRLICEPFLKDKDDTRLENNTFLQRPGIELILRLRLKEFENADVITQTLLRLAPDGSPEFEAARDVENESELRQIALALLSENKITGEEVTNAIQVSNIEQKNLNMFIKTIKALINKLIENLKMIHRVSNEIAWTPLPDERGPEFGSDVSKFIIPKRKIFRLERAIQDLEAQELLNSLEREASGEDIGNFSVGFLTQEKRTYEKELKDLKNLKIEGIRKASNALREIEAITGEISGLGLVDIFAIYTALWAIDLDVLISLLDNNAFDRLYEFNPELRTRQVEDRRATGPVHDIFEAMRIFEAQVISILAFADKLIDDELGSPKQRESGTVTE